MLAGAAPSAKAAAYGEYEKAEGRPQVGDLPPVIFVHTLPAMKNRLSGTGKAAGLR